MTSTVPFTVIPRSWRDMQLLLQSTFCASPPSMMHPALIYALGELRKSGSHRRLVPHAEVDSSPPQIVPRQSLVLDEVQNGLPRDDRVLVDHAQHPVPVGTAMPLSPLEPVAREGPDPRRVFIPLEQPSPSGPELDHRRETSRTCPGDADAG